MHLLSHIFHKETESIFSYILKTIRHIYSHFSLL